MSVILLAIRVDVRFRKNWRISLVNVFRFETKSDVVKSTISQS
jgi:hypothetical protein